MKPDNLLIIGHSIVRRFHQFIKDDKNVSFCEDMGLAKTHRISFTSVGGKKFSDIIKDDTDFDLLD